MITSGIFGTMSVIGYTTKVNLSKYSTYFGMAVMGLFIAIIANWFLNSSGFSYIISVIGVILFTALTAYDTQRIKEMAQQMQYNNADNNTTTKMAIYGALHLYVNFINIFIFLLRLFAGGRR
jgi:hypothetical protein